MTPRIRIAGLEVELDLEREWGVTSRNGASRELEREIEGMLNAGYGIEWEPPFGVYEPSVRNASAQAIAEDLGAQILELDPPDNGPASRVH